MSGRESNSVSEPALYLGEFLRTVDAGRLILPLEWRPKNSPKKFAICLWPVTNPDHLVILPPDRWLEVLMKFRGIRLSDKAAVKAQRRFSRQTCERTLDSAARLALPDELIKPLGIHDRCKLVGVMDRFEIWPVEKFEEAEKISESDDTNQTIERLEI